MSSTYGRVSSFKELLINSKTVYLAIPALLWRFLDHSDACSCFSNSECVQSLQISADMDGSKSLFLITLPLQPSGTCVCCFLLSSLYLFFYLNLVFWFPRFNIITHVQLFYISSQNILKIVFPSPKITIFYFMSVSLSSNTVLKFFARKSLL